MLRLTRPLAMTLLAVLLAPAGSGRLAATPGWTHKLDPVLGARAGAPGRSRVVLRVAAHGSLTSMASQASWLGGRIVRALPLVDGVALDVPNALLPVLAGNPLVQRISSDRVVAGAMERTSATIGATGVREQLGYDGHDVGVAVVDSGAMAEHDDLRARGPGPSRVRRFVDFVNGGTTAYDDYGHGTHVAGIIAGNGTDSGGARSGIAPGARLVVLKVLDNQGRGRISDVIAALDYAVANKDALGIRIINLSVATGVYESYDTDPLTIAAKRAVSAGIVVVAAAGNSGRGPHGSPQYAGITAPGNAPWVLTVGASSHMGTVDRADDTIAPFSSRGPSAVDYSAKPDLVAPGVGIESLADPFGSLYGAANAMLLPGSVATPYLPYMSLSGTSMSAPVVAGTVALMLQANPALTPNAVKAILQYTAQRYPGHDYLTEGAGFLNARGAVELAAYLASPSTRPYPATSDWSAQLLWGNHLASGGRLTADANAWSLEVTWGAGVAPGGAPIRWGTVCNGLTCALLGPSPWQAACLDLLCSVLTSDAAATTNVVWGTLCGGADCAVPWNAQSVSATSDPEADTVVWGTSDGEGDTVVWGTSCADPSCTPPAWKRE